jgi:hypothetical protein
VLGCLELSYKNCLCSSMDGEHCSLKEEQLWLRLGEGFVVLGCLELSYKNCLCSTMDGEHCRVKEEQFLVKIRGRVCCVGLFRTFLYK